METGEVPLRRREDDHVRRLMGHYFQAHGLAETPENRARFVAVYECFLRATPERERRAARLDRLVRAAFGLKEAQELDSDAEARVAAELTALSARYEAEQARRREAEAVQQAVRRQLGQVTGAVSGLFQELHARLEAHRASLAEREAALARQEEAYRERLAAVAALERELSTRLEHRLHGEATAALEAQVASLTAELAAVREELGDLAEEGAGDSPYPLAAAVRRLVARAAGAGLDALTGLATRASFNEAIAERIAAFREAARAGRAEGENYTLLFLDVDHFKRINDTHGHLAGDRVLAAVGERLRNLRRGGDRAFRFGGEEFVCLLPRTPASGGETVAEILRHEIAGLEVKAADGSPIPVTVSVGVCDALTSGAAVVHCADRALYRAKEQGRNRTVTFREEDFVRPLPQPLPEPFVAAVRDRLLAEEEIALVAVEPGGDGAAQAARLAELFPGPSATVEGRHLYLAPGLDGQAAVARVAEALGDLPYRAGATDTEEVPGPAEEPPAARAHLLLAELLTLLA